MTGGVYDISRDKFEMLEIKDGFHKGYTMEEFEGFREYAGISKLLNVRGSAGSSHNGCPINSPKSINCGLFSVLSEMRHRNATHEADKVAEIGFLMSDRLSAV